MTVKDIYDIIDKEIPFSTAEKWDNCGLIIGSMNNITTGIITCLDVTDKVIEEAVQNNANLIISHHPIIFNPLKKISSNSVVYKAIRNDINVICTHTPTDIAECGINGIAYKEISKEIPLTNKKYIDDTCPIGWIAEINSEKKITCNKFAEILCKVFECEKIRFTSNTEDNISKIAFCSGSGGSMLDLVTENECQAYITGDVKYDCCHYNTEIAFSKLMSDFLNDRIQNSNIKISESDSEKGYIKTYCNN